MCCLKVQVTVKEEVEVTISVLEEVTVFNVISQAFDCSIRKDEHLAIAFFQRGIVSYKRKRQVTSVI